MFQWVQNYFYVVFTCGTVLQIAHEFLFWARAQDLSLTAKSLGINTMHFLVYQIT